MITIDCVIVSCVCVCACRIEHGRTGCSRSLNNSAFIPASLLFGVLMSGPLIVPLFSIFCRGIRKLGANV
jgi:hypothetical protein